jgi:hypothetical protein
MNDNESTESKPIARDYEARSRLLAPHVRNENSGNGFLCIPRCVEDIRSDVSRQTSDIVWNDGISDVNQSILEKDMPSRDVQETGNLLDI